MELCLFVTVNIGSGDAGEWKLFARMEGPQ